MLSESVTTDRGIVAEHLTWTPDGRRDPTLFDVSFTVPPGARVALLGASGAGKSTLLKALAGVLEESGTGTLTGRLQVPTAGLLMQEPRDAVVADTVGRDVAFGPENLGLARPRIWEQVETALAQVSFPYDPSRATTALSGGELQRLSLAGAVASEPSLFLLDEPTAMLDETASATVRAVVRETVERTHATLVVVEHRIGPWLDLLDHAVLLGPGGVVRAFGPIADVMMTHREEIAASGVWLPGLPVPVPVPLPAAAVPARARSGVTSTGAALGRGAALVGGASFEVRPGRLLALTGPSGSGKSTTLRLLTGMEQPDAGSIRPDTARMSSRELAARVGYVPQHSSLGFVATTVREELLTTARALGVADDARAEALLGHFGLVDLASASPFSLSGGEQRRLNLATALMTGPDVLALDEPTVGQDRHTWALVAGAVRGAADLGLGVVAASHDLDLVALADEQVSVPPPVPRPGPVAGSATGRAADPSSGRLVRHCRPLALLLAGLVVAVASLFISTPTVALVAAAAVVISLPLYLPPLSMAWKRAAPVGLAALSVGWSSWLLGSQDLTTAAVAMTRIMCMVLPGAMLMAHLKASPLGDDLAQRGKLPARVVVACVVALQRLEHLQDVWQDLAHLRRLRGLTPSGLVGRIWWAGVLTFALLVESLRSANVTAVAMDSRGFAHASRRTWAEPSPWRLADWVAVALAVGYAALVLGVRLH